MNKLLTEPKHASALDWDFSHPYWAIITAHYLSPPSSLQWKSPISAYMYAYYLCKHNGTLKLPEARLVTYFRVAYYGYGIEITFRNTAPPGNSNINNCYRVLLRPQFASYTLEERQDGAVVRSWLGRQSTGVANTWYRIRISWWLAWDILMFRLEHEVDDEWVQQGDEISISDPLFGAEDIQRCGLGAYCSNMAYALLIDDTEIWAYP